MATRRLKVGDRIHYRIHQDTAEHWHGVTAEVIGFEKLAGVERLVGLRVIDVPEQRYDANGRMLQPWPGQEYKGGMESPLVKETVILLAPVPEFPDRAAADKWLDAQTPTSDL